MIKQSVKFALVTLVISSTIGCAKKAEDINAEFGIPQMNVDPKSPNRFPDGKCTAAFNPITISDPTGTVTDSDTVEAKGELSYVGAEFYTELQENDKVVTQYFASEAAGGNLSTICKTISTVGLPSGTTIDSELDLPTSSHAGTIGMERYLLNIGTNSTALSSGMLDSRNGSSIKSVMAGTTSAFYDLGNGNYVLRVVKSESQSGFTLKNSALIRFHQ